jgi:hypothetical protein
MFSLPPAPLSYTLLLCVVSARTALFRVITQPVVVIPYCCLGTTYTFKDGTDRLSRNVARNCHHSLRYLALSTVNTQCTLTAGYSERNIWSANYDVYGEETEQPAQLLPVTVRTMLQTDSDVTR